MEYFATGYRKFARYAAKYSWFYVYGNIKNNAGTHFLLVSILEKSILKTMSRPCTCTQRMCERDLTEGDL